MPCDYSKYPDNWKTEIRPRILDRDGHRCKWCHVPDREWIVRSSDGWNSAISRDEEGAVFIILTIAHLDHDIENNEDENLAALCQKCHLTHDAKQHSQTQRRNGEAKDGQIQLIEAKA